MRGGPAKVAVVASGFFGSISGSPTANVIGTGTFTIPMMKKNGFEPEFAAAVEATASTGAVIAHHQAPLAAVRRELAAAEQRAKNEGGRDAFSITIIKRSGGTLRLTAKWGEPVALLQDLRQFLAHGDVSRRAAYHTLEWLDAQTLPTPEGDGAMLQSLLAYQFDRQAQGAAKGQAAPLAQRLTELTLAQPAKVRITWLRNFISVAEFLAREVRSTAGKSA